jgi:hypothetical protein
MRWRRIGLSRHARLERFDRGATPRESDYFDIGREVEVIGFKLRSHNSVYFIPLNNQMFLAEAKDVWVVGRKPIETNESDANDHNTCLFTCRECGKWLHYMNEGYGTEHGWCGCEEAK